MYNSYAQNIAGYQRQLLSFVRSSHWQCSIKKFNLVPRAIFRFPLIAKRCTVDEVVKKLFLKISKNWQENNFVGDSFSIKLQTRRNFVKYLGTPILQNICKRLPPPQTKDVNWAYVRRSIYVLCLQGLFSYNFINFAWFV